MRACSAFLWSSTLLLLSALLRGETLLAFRGHQWFVKKSCFAIVVLKCFAGLLADDVGMWHYAAIVVVAVVVEEAVRWWLYIVHRYCGMA